MKAMILAAGFGKRLRPTTLFTPKPLVSVAGKPIIYYHIERLAKAGIKDLVINLGWLGDQIEEALGSGAEWGVNIHYSTEAPPLETGGGILKALPLLTDGQTEKSNAYFVVINSDIFTDLDITNLTIPDGKLAHLVMVDNPDFNPEGDFYLEEGIVYEKNLTDKKHGLTFSGVSIISPRLFDGFKIGETFPLATVLMNAIKQDRVSGQYYNGFWTDIGSKERLQALEKYLSLKNSQYQEQCQNQDELQNQNNHQNQSKTS